MIIDIFVSYASEDKKRAERLVRHLQSQGRSVWWDAELVAGQEWDTKIEEALRSSKCVIVLWSKTSVESRFVRDEAEIARNRDVLLPVLIDEVDLPLGHNRTEAADLRGWRGDPHNDELANLCDRVASVLSGKEENTARERARTGRRRRQVARRVGLGLLALGVSALLYTQPWRRDPPPTAPPTISDFVAESPDIPWNGSTTLSWSSANSDRAVLTANEETLGELEPKGSRHVRPQGATTYRIRAMRGNVRGTDVKEVIVRVASPDLSGKWKSSTDAYYEFTRTRGGYKWAAYTVQKGRATFHNDAYATATFDHMSSAVPSFDSRAAFAPIPPDQLHPPGVSWKHGEKFTKVKEAAAFISHKPLTVYGKWTNQQGREFDIDQSPGAFTWSVPVQFESADITLEGSFLTVRTTVTPEFGSLLSSRTEVGTAIGRVGADRPQEIRWESGVTFQKIASFPF